MHYDLDDALGAVGEVSVLWRAIGMHLRYTRLSYTLAATGLDLDVNTVGLAFSIALPSGSYGTS